MLSGKVDDYEGKTRIDQHAARAQAHAQADDGNHQFVIDSLNIIKEKNIDRFNELMNDSQLQSIYQNSRTQESSGGSQRTRSQSNRGRQQQDNSQQTTSNSGLPKAQVLLTVGTNPLPVWVAWKHLVKLNKLEVPTPIQVRLVHTDGTDKQKGILKDKCGNLPEYPSGVTNQNTTKRDVKTSPGNPKVIRDNIQEYVFGHDGKSLPESIEHIHVHYTGGTQAMGVETVAAIEDKVGGNQKINDKSINFSTSYLNARDKTGVPKIVSRPTGELVPDTRKLNIEITLDFIAELNSSRTNSAEKLKYRDRHGGTVERDVSQPPSEQERENGINALQCNFGNNFASLSKNQKADLLESAAYDAFMKALECVGREHYKLFKNIYALRNGAKKDFELDVVAVLGYQVVVVSCSITSDAGEIKRKAMEGFHRAKQLGGDEACTIVLCAKESSEDTKIIEEDLHDEIGTDYLPLQVWGKDKWPTLSEPDKLKGAFKEYLTDTLVWK